MSNRGGDVMPIDIIRTYSNCDAVTIIWFGKPTAGCRKFALERKVKGKSGTTFVDTFVGFKGQKHKAHEKRPSTEWPVQRYVWSDYFIDDGDQVAYRAIPMIGTADDLKNGAAGRMERLE